MNAKDAVALRIQVLCAERSITVNELANRCGVAPSTIYSMLNQKSKNPGVVSLKKYVMGWKSACEHFLTTQYLRPWNQLLNNARW